MAYPPARCRSDAPIEEIATVMPFFPRSETRSLINDALGRASSTSIRQFVSRVKRLRLVSSGYPGGGFGYAYHIHRNKLRPRVARAPLLQRLSFQARSLLSFKGWPGLFPNCAHRTTTVSSGGSVSTGNQQGYPSLAGGIFQHPVSPLSGLLGTVDSKAHFSFRDLCST